MSAAACGGCSVCCALLRAVQWCALLLWWSPDCRATATHRHTLNAALSEMLSITSGTMRSCARMTALSLILSAHTHTGTAATQDTQQRMRASLLLVGVSLLLVASAVESVWCFIAHTWIVADGGGSILPDLLFCLHLACLRCSESGWRRCEKLFVVCVVGTCVLVCL